LARKIAYAISAGEKWLFEEVKLLHQLHIEIRATHLKYQSWFMIAHGVLLAATVNLRLDERFLDHIRIYYLVCMIGFALGLCFWFLQLRHILDADDRMKRIKEICTLLRRPVYNDKRQVGEFMSYVGGDVIYSGKFNLFSYSRIRLIVDSIFPLLWSSLLLIQVF
jgi:hypothetical protein